MKRWAYLVGHIDTSKSPPEVVLVGVHSASAGSITCGDETICFDLFRAPGDDYEEAIRKVLATVVGFPKQFGWVAPILDQNHASTLEEILRTKRGETVQ